MPYLDCLDDNLDPHYCEDGCELIEEHARISTGAWIHKDAITIITADPTNAAVWLTQIALGKVILLPLLTGTFDGGSPKTVPGFGRIKERYSGSDFKATIRDPVYKKNWAHYRSLVGKNSWYFAYGSETQLHISGNPVSVKPKNPITDNLDDLVVWEAEIDWTEYFTPAPHDMPDIFNCVNPESAPVITQQPTGQNVAAGNPITLTVAATGTAPLQYQWLKDGVNIPGATSAVYTKTNCSLDDGGTFTVTVTNTLGSAVSNPAIVSVADVTFDTVIDFAAATSGTKENITATVAAPNTSQQLQFNKDTSITGLPNSMSISLGGSEVMTVDFPGDYMGHSFRYVHTDGSAHMGTFANGTVVL